MPRYVLNVTTRGAAPAGDTTVRFKLTATSVKTALQRLFTAKPQYDVATNIAITVGEDADEDIT